MTRDCLRSGIGDDWPRGLKATPKRLDTGARRVRPLRGPGARPERRGHGFYYIYLPQRRILADFYTLLPEESYDYRMVDGADTPRESFLHILATHYQYLDGIRTGRLTFSEVDAPSDATKAALLAEMDRIEEERWGRLSGAGFDPDAAVEAPWGEMRAGDAIFLLRDHDILHVGWNLALMDHLDMERFPSLREYWG